LNLPFFFWSRRTAAFFSISGKSVLLAQFSLSSPAVKAPREAAMDVEFMRTASEVALKQASSLGSGTQALDSDMVLAALKERLDDVRFLHNFVSF
jgi:hypothetical protein